MTEQPKKRWQFSLSRALVAMTQICVSLAVARALVINDSAFGLINHVLALAWAIMGFGSAVGVIVYGKLGAVVGAAVGSAAGAVVAVAYFLLVMWAFTEM